MMRRPGDSEADPAILAEIADAKARLEEIEAFNADLAWGFAQVQVSFCEILQITLSELDRGSPAGAAACLRRALATYAGRPADAVLQ